ncbi:sugar O-acetyltransferase [Enterovibrio coralii]|uniref:Acetyltransferase n=1 Tax=Enterovibrio coralii TaxID=294935 RepID=A0A135IBH8_9GAMM|nr:sugar O-acetyltransferase [Enterovibrio coralii]KXF82821.1 galactoside O-acetyltransferase [Enterovibrio coralii]
MDISEKIHSCEIFIPSDPTLVAEQTRCLEILYDFNHSRPSETEKRKAILKRFLAEIGDNSHIEPPLHANWGKHTHLGNNVYINFNLTLLDDTHIYIDDHVSIGPNVTIATAGHPIDPERRKQGAQFNVSVHIKSGAWIGANTVIVPGVTIGENTVIGAGSVVTKDIPSGVVAVGNPCRVLRKIGEHDNVFYFKQRRFK